MPQGGVRTAKPGAVYRNRSDLTGSADAQYGDNINRETVARATPNTTPSRGAPTGGPPPPGTLVPLTAPSQRPGEPVTAGLPIGPGPGPEALTAGGAVNDALYELRALAARFPSRDLDRIIALAEEEA